MAEQFKEQGGAATMDPGVVRRWLTSRMMSRMCSEQAQVKARRKAELQRTKSGLPHTVEYFHQVDDGYSHLAVQLLAKIQARYEVELRCHLVSECAGANLPEPQLLSRLSCYDANQIAPHYGLEPPTAQSAAATDCIALAESILAGLSNQDFIAHAVTVNTALWRNDLDGLRQLSKQFGEASSERRQAAQQAGNDRRAQLKHYSGAMFFYGNEWYWGVDRLHYLEKRLGELGLDSTPGQALLAPRQDVVNGPLNASNAAKQSSQLTLVIYASLRSPYTAVAFDRTVTLANELGVNLELRPVLPMVMRGVPATMEKGKYILFDAGREARAAGVPFGPCADPIGEPTRRAYSLYAWAAEQGKAVEFISAFLRCAWVEAINTNTDRGMQAVVQRAGLDWSVAKTIIGTPGWQAMVEDNRLAMYELGLWGVPSYQLLDEQNNTVLALWGQDRLWLVSKVIQEQLNRLTTAD
ncbi:MAG: 2-hydroxychromene-2-carboxylate isomerase [Gammaproteobacteria bacterium]|nr:2-hydroxychromene-2-carboxylate isomerase [Gammaproteobacteria bacterium]